MKASTTLRCVSLGTSSRTTAISQASALASAVGRAGTGGGSALLAGDGVVPALLGGDPLLVGAAGAGQAVEQAQRRSVSMVRPSSTSEPSSSPSRTSSASSLWAAAAKERAKVSWWSLPGSASSSSRRRPCSQVAAQRRPVGRCGEVVDRLGGVAGDPRGAERVGLGGDVAEHERRRSRWRSARRRGSCPRRRPSTAPGPASRRAARGRRRRSPASARRAGSWRRSGRRR